VDGGEKFGRGTQCQLKWRGCVALPRGEIESHARGSRGGGAGPGVRSARRRHRKGRQWCCGRDDMTSVARPAAREAAGGPAQLHSKKFDLFKYFSNSSTLI
jgi:hypothetical protein